MRLLTILLSASLLTSCGLLKVPGRSLKAVGRTFGFTASAETPGSTNTHSIALKTTTEN